MISAAILAILACPNCETRPPLKESGQFLVCTICNRHYPIINGIPHLLPESGLSPEEASSFEFPEKS